jgi:GAF domain-containing protein
MDPAEEMIGLDGFAEVASALVARAPAMVVGGMEDVLHQVLDAAVTAIASSDFAGVLLCRDGQITEPLVSEPAVARLNDLQRTSGEGPCLEAIATRSICYSDDIGHDSRWPEFGPRASDIGINSALGVPVEGTDVLGAVNLYARQTGAFGAVEREKAQILSVFAGFAVRVAEAREEQDRRADNLLIALRSREVIGQAQGILMERDHLSSAAAFEVLRRASQRRNRKLRDVAQRVVDTGLRPDDDSPAPPLRGRGTDPAPPGA